MGEERKVYKVLVGKPEGKRPLGRPRRRWEDGVRMELREIGLGGVDWIRLAQDRDQCCCEYGDKPSGSCATELVIASISRYVTTPVVFSSFKLIQFYRTAFLP
jgi:hypothetical protein